MCYDLTGPTHMNVRPQAGKLTGQPLSAVPNTVASVERKSTTPVITGPHRLHRHATGQPVIMGSSELGFGLGFYGPLPDDTSLGFSNGKVPEYIVVDGKCCSPFLSHPAHAPGAAYRKVDDVLNRRLAKVFTAGDTSVYAWRGGDAP